jgi:DNA polymerase I
MNRLLLIDGHNLLFKAFFGIPEKINAEGKSIHGVIGFIGMTVKIIRRIGPTHVLVVFDPEETPSRTESYPEYKSNRKDYSLVPERENPFTQLAGIKKALETVRIKYCEQPGFEADDLIASYASPPDYQAVIVSSDTDFFQLVNETTGVYHYHGKNSTWYNAAELTKKYGFPPSRYLEYKALVGDKSDTIQGVRGIGPKTALKVMKNERALTPEEQAIFERNLELIRLNTSVALPYRLDELVYQNHLDMFGIGPVLRNAGII